MEYGHIEFGSAQIHYRIERSIRRQTVSVKVGREGVRLVAPWFVTDTQLAGFVQHKAAWILQKQQGFEQQHAYLVPPRQFVSGETYRYLGRQYRLERLAESEGMGARLKGRYLEVYADTPSKAREVLQLWYKQRAKERLPERLEFYSVRLGRQAPPFMISGAANRWGSCNRQGEVRLNWRIVMAPMRLIDYVVVHELCHLEELNHSTDFWKLVERLLPDYRGRKDQLELEGGLFRL